jgi:hypothetical protein
MTAQRSRYNCLGLGCNSSTLPNCVVATHAGRFGDWVVRGNLLDPIIAIRRGPVVRARDVVPRPVCELQIIAIPGTSAWAVKAISRSQWNDGYGANSGPSRGDPVGPVSALLRHSRMQELAARVLRSEAAERRSRSRLPSRGQA